MNKIVAFLILFTFVGCGTNNINPLGEAYFIKFYGAEGDQMGILVQSTPDGGFIVAGNSITEFGGTSDYLLIKTDAQGNQEWLQTYDFDGSGGNDLLTDVLVEDNSYVIAGTSAINGIDKMVLLRVSLDGTLLDSSIIFPLANNSFKANGISPLSAGGYLVTGPIVGGAPSQTGKSLISVVNADFSIADSLSFPSVAPTVGKETVFVKGLEVVNHFDPAGTETNNYLFFGYVNSDEGPKLNIFQFRESLGSAITTPIAIDYNNSIITDVLQISNNSYKMLASTDNETYMINVTESPSVQAYTLGSDQILRSGKLIQGVSFALTEGGNFLIASNTTPENSTITSSSIAEVSPAGTINWERVFGTEIAYTSGKVITLNNGAVVYTGTAGFKGQTKVFLIKLKSNGEMK